MNFLKHPIPKMSGAVLATPQDAAAIIDALRHTPEIAAAVASNESRKRSARQELAKRLTKAEDDMAKRVVALDAALDATMHEVKIAEAKLAEARVAASSARMAKTQASFGFTAEHDAIERELRDTCSPEIGLFITEMRDEWDRTLKLTPEISVDTITNQITGSRVRIETGRGTASILARVAAIREAIATAEEMKLEADQSSVSMLLQELRQNLPAA